MSSYYQRNNLKSNFSKTEILSLHLRNEHAHKKIVTLFLMLDQIFSYKQHNGELKRKLVARNNILRNLVSTTS